jgi:hypothetical protein
MRRILVCTGVLGGGTALVFALAAMTAIAFPNGTTVNAGWNGGPMVRGGWNGGLVPAPAPVFVPAIEPPMVEGDIAIPDPAFKALPGDTVQAGDAVEPPEDVPQP